MTGLWDIHNHMLPGLDDGSSCMEETFDLLQDAYHQGIRNIIFTPHYRKHMFETSIEDRQKVFSDFLEKYQKDWKKKLPAMTFRLGCEFHMHPSKELDLLEQEPYRMPGKKVLLTEFIRGDSYNRIQEVLDPFLWSGYTCIIAHAERYGLKTDEIRKLHEVPGIEIQVNADSILGFDGFRMKHFTKRLLKSGCIDLIASDVHDTANRQNHLGQCADWISKKYGVEAAKSLFITNPERVFKSYE